MQQITELKIEDERIFDLVDEILLKSEVSTNNEVEFYVCCRSSKNCGIKRWTTDRVRVKYNTATL